MTPVEVRLFESQAVVSATLIARFDKQVDNGAHQKKTAQNICTTFLLNDTSEARTIAVA